MEADWKPLMCNFCHTLINVNDIRKLFLKPIIPIWTMQLSLYHIKTLHMFPLC